ncbi:hypothetical protein J41TS12_09250 [Paenibacillus antibioticophila]|uniref:chitinase n=1 Tax=Paenibacillus antibioticophila TaxID=1274374 RepID=A0A919XNK1_9BACL|nr:glycosyl hydrolase family 18 protein [Paenibacillus antibioticophila]GIO36064.1 hypothetical protein J41TS12_09250 [Paenibacillus antibioticophila]
MEGNILPRRILALITGLALIIGLLFPGIPIQAEPAGPYNLTVEEGSLKFNQVRLQWEGSPEVHVWDENGNMNGGYLNIWNPGLSVKPETTYRLYLTDLSDRSLKSNIIEFTTPPMDPSTLPEPPLTPPHNLTVTDVTYSAITLSWSGDPSKGYPVYVNGNYSGEVWNWSNSYTYTIPEATVTGAVYKFMVRAFEPPEQSADSNVVTIKWGELEAPQDLQIVTATKTAASIAWAKVDGATEYHILLDGEWIGTSDTNRYAITGLSENQTYRFSVIARNQLWESPESDSVEVIPGRNYQAVTYYTSWARSPEGRDFKPQDLDATKFTHIQYAFADLCWNGVTSGGADCQKAGVPLHEDYKFNGEVVLGDPVNDLLNFTELNAKKAAQPDLKLILSVGGWTWSDFFSVMAATEQTRLAFANSAVEFIREFGLDGIDIDWEYPVEGGEEGNTQSPDDRENFTLLMKTVREALDAAGAEDGRYYLLTIASSQADNFIINADLVRSVEYLDFISIMTYDYSGTWDSRAHHNSPLFYDPAHFSVSASRNHASGSLLANLTSGIPGYKLNLGVPFYGVGWLEVENGEYGAILRKDLNKDETFGTWESFKFDYQDLEGNYVNKNGYTRYWNEYAKVAYLYNKENGNFISYNDQQSMMYTAALVRSLDIAGIMSWESHGDRSLTLTNELVRNLPINGLAGAARLEQPRQLTVKSKAATALTVAWERLEEADAYEVYANRTYQGTTKENSFTLNRLQPQTDYLIQILAIHRAEDGSITRVSDFSEGMQAKTDAAPSTSPGTSSGTGSVSPGSPATVLPQDPVIGEGEGGSLQIKLRSEKVKGVTIAKVDSAAVLKAVKGSSSPRLELVVDSSDGQVKLTVSSEIVAAMAAKGDQAEILITAGKVQYRLPLSALKLEKESRSIVISILKPDSAEQDAIKTAVGDIAAKLLAEPLQFKIEITDGDGNLKELSDFGRAFVSRIFQLGRTAPNSNQATGILWDAKSSQLLHVPTLFEEDGEGNWTAELKRTGNSIYAVIEVSPETPEGVPAWAKEDVAAILAKQIVSSTEAKVYRADEKITRAEFASLLVHSLGLNLDSGASTFTDVGADHPSSREIEAAVKSGLIKGRTPDIFDPSALITRQEMAVMMDNAAQFAGKRPGSDASMLAGFKDQAEVSAFARQPVARLLELQIMNGVSATSLAPKAHATKAQAAVVVMRMLRVLELSN